MLRSLFFWLFLAGAAMAAEGEYSAITNTNAALRDAPNQSAGQIGIVPRGTELAVPICFYEGLYCAVESPAYKGYVAGDLITIVGDTNTVAAAEKARWDLIRENRRAALASDFDAGDVVVWGDSLSTRTLGDRLAKLLPGRAISMQGVPGQTGKQIAERMLADTRYAGRFKVIWDRHFSQARPEQYLEELLPMLEFAARTGDFIVVSDIRQLVASDRVDVASDKATTDAINRELSRLYPRNFLDVAALLESPSTRQADGVHLSEAGEQAVAAALAAAINMRQAAQPTSPWP